ncbi:hypothetical protein HOC62_03960 [Candidatus Woesearchaeota archaeon]|jgi:predicted DNA-binding protein|nr:hypothetical protein [Candidatus Woesearchaeota archaeon]
MKKIIVNIADESHAQLKVISKRTGSPMAFYVKLALDRYLRENNDN